MIIIRHMRDAIPKPLLQVRGALLGHVDCEDFDGRTSLRRVISKIECIIGRALNRSKRVKSFMFINVTVHQRSLFSSIKGLPKRQRVPKPLVSSWDTLFRSAEGLKKTSFAP